MNRRKKATSIPQKVKEAVYERDNHKCVLCGKWAERSWACAHYIRRSQGGLGIEKNIVTLCPVCHMAYDESSRRNEIKAYLGEYLSNHYDEWSEDELRYRKWTEVQQAESQNEKGQLEN